MDDRPGSTAIPEALTEPMPAAADRSTSLDGDKETLKPKASRSMRRVLVESILLGIFTGVATVVVQRLVWGETSMPISIGMTVLIEVLYFKTIAKTF